MSVSVSVGRGPSESGNSRNSPGRMRTPGSAVQVTVLTASVMVRSPTATGAARAASVIDAVQPGTGEVRTLEIGWSAGSLTSSLTVPAVSDSLGTRMLITV